ncbi:hypothetical protein HG535_0C04130 [Zygotorulaspora mrakii]|uniref:Uncharacterized protein n=1 Tax=Zygotorulaspora mrakii TaxID=42260 RepID=A0A7H9B245_ZYGMR|nr:uncharacterized protein HG535_0C04130 [Zygotorulaspora mrakii]QLG72059.1 hypothetical protein HG535_0C04130 [Zygotorulaspora mrakii]
MSGDQSKNASSDPRFAKIHSDPKFRNIRQKGLKVKLDDRFSKKDLEIKRTAKVDKYGRILDGKEQNKDLKDFDKYYEKSDEESEEDDDAESKVVKVDRARGEVSSDDYTSSESESSSESELESDVESDIEADRAQPESGESSKTLAVVNLDWDNVRAADLMITFSSFLPSGGKIEKIAIYPSEFGKERMKREEVEGPPRELFTKNKKKNKRQSVESSDDSDSDVDIKDLYEEGDVDEAVDKRALRQYQLERLRYYYAIVYCNNISSAQNIYSNCDGTEYESTANIFDIRYVPDGMAFDDEPKDRCEKLPKNYQPLQFSTDALQHSNVKLTWDETPADRVNVAKKAFTQKEIEDMDFKAYLASDSDESEEENNEATKNKLKSLVGISSGFDDFGKGRDNENEDDAGEVDMEITFTPGLDDDSRKNNESVDQEETTIEKVRRKEKERRKLRKQKLKELKKTSEQEKRDKLKSLKGKKHEHIGDSEKENSKSRAELELLMMEDDDDTEKSINKKAHFNLNEIVRSEKEKSKKGKYQDTNKIVEDTFEPNLDDDRFKEMFEGHDFAIDPSQPEFRETNAMKQILKERTKRSHDKNSKKRQSPSSGGADNENGTIASIVSKLKHKAGKKKARR